MKLLDGVKNPLLWCAAMKTMLVLVAGRRPGGISSRLGRWRVCQGAETPLYLWCNSSIGLLKDVRHGQGRHTDRRPPPRPAPITLTGAEMVIRALKDQGVTHIFGYPGGAVLPIYDALFEAEGITHVLVRHEQGAAHAAEGYARSTGKPGVVLVTSGPGATNAVTGLTDALMDSIPLVVHHRPGAHPSDRHRRLPGMRHGRHHPALHQAQLAGEGRERSVAHPARGLPDRHHRPARPGGGRHSQGRAVPEGRLCRRRQSVQHRTYRPKTDPDLRRHRARRWR